MDFTYNLSYVFLSVVIAVMSAYTALELSSRVNSSSAGSGILWRLGGATALGMGVWSMHFIGMLAMVVPFELGFDIPRTIGSAALAFASSAVGLGVMSGGRPSWKRVVFAGLVLGSAISGMHYLGMSALLVVPGFRYDYTWVGLSLLVAAGASMAAVWIAYLVDRARSKTLVRVLASFVMGSAIACMHYSGMQAVHFAPGTVCLTGAGTLNHDQVVAWTTLISLVTLAVALLLSLVSSQLKSHEDAQARLLRQNQELERKAHTDPLTGLHNRAALDDELPRAIDLARDAGKSLSVLFLDLDGFKAVNDVLGHLQGDALLRIVGQRLRSSVREHDRVYRVSGDEFVIVTQPGYDQAAETAMAERVLAAVRTPYDGELVNARVSASLGLACFPDNGDDPRSLLLAADASMYAAKQEGKDRVRAGGASIAIVRARPELVRDLERALQGEELRLAYQPIVTSASEPRAMPGAEALLRWNHPHHGLLLPGQFVPEAEAHGLSGAMGTWVLERAIAEMSRNTFHEPKWVNVNLAAAQLQDRLLPQRIEALLHRYNVSVHQIGVEITESMSMLNVAVSQQVLGALREMGMSVSMDDFGTGYSSLSQLHRLPLDKLKIDRSFVENIEHDHNALRIVEAILALSQALKLSVVAEGVETAFQYDTLSRLGAAQLQGYGICRPVAGWAELNQVAAQWRQGIIQPPVRRQ